MLCPDHELDPAGHPRGTHGLGELDRLRERNERVFRALKCEHGGIVLGDECERRRHDRGLGLIVRSPAQKVLDPGFANVGDISGGQVGGTEVIDDGLDPAVRSTGGDVSFKAVIRACEAQHQGQVASRREADRANSFGVDLVFLGVDLEPANRGLNVMNLGRESVRGTKAVLGRDRDVSALGKLRQDWPDIGLVPLAPGTAVNHHDRGKRPVTCCRPGQVELELRRAGLGVDDVLFGCRLGRLCSPGGQRDEAKTQDDGAQPKNRSINHEVDSAFVFSSVVQKRGDGIQVSRRSRGHRERWRAIIPAGAAGRRRAGPRGEGQSPVRRRRRRASKP